MEIYGRAHIFSRLTIPINILQDRDRDCGEYRHHRWVHPRPILAIITLASRFWSSRSNWNSDHLSVVASVVLLPANATASRDGDPEGRKFGTYGADRAKRGSSRIADMLFYSFAMILILMILTAGFLAHLPAPAAAQESLLPLSVAAAAAIFAFTR